MAQVITTSVTVSFEAGEDSLYTAEVDDRDDGLNAGDTSFRPGDDVYILLFKTSDMSTIYSEPTSGSLSSAGQASKEITEFISFVDETSATLTYPVTSGASVTWLGRSLPNLKLNDLGSVYTVDRPQGEDHWIGVLKVEYTSAATAYKLSNTLIPNEDEYEIVVYFVGQSGPS